MKNKLLSLVYSFIRKAIPFVPSFFFRFPLPKFVIIEPTNICNLRCPLCPTNSTMTRKKGMMNIDNCRRIIDQLSGSLKGVYFNFAGEPTLNPKLFDMVSYAEKKGLYTFVSTNTTTLDKHINKIFDSGLSDIGVCLDGAVKKTHEAYRRGSDFNKIKANIAKLTGEKKRRGVKKPNIILQFVVMKQNEKEIPKIIKLADKLGVDKLSLKTASLGSTISLKEKIERSKKYLPENKNLSRYFFDGGKLAIKSRPSLCDWVKKSMIFWNGDVTMCCYDLNGRHVVGNIFKDGGFKKIWFSDKYAKLRKNVLMRKLPICRSCTMNDCNIDLNLFSS